MTISANLLLLACAFPRAAEIIVLEELGECQRYRCAGAEHDLTPQSLAKRPAGSQVILRM
jgi:hypothetical protein